MSCIMSWLTRRTMDRIQVLKDFIQKEPNDPFNKYALAMEYVTTDPKQAEILFDKLISDHPEYLPTYYQAAHLFWELGKFERALEVFEKGIELAQSQNNSKTLAELKNAFQNFQFETEE